MIINNHENLAILFLHFSTHIRYWNIGKYRYWYACIPYKPNIISVLHISFVECSVSFCWAHSSHDLEGKRCRDYEAVVANDNDHHDETQNRTVQWKHNKPCNCFWISLTCKKWTCSVSKCSLFWTCTKSSRFSQGEIFLWMVDLLRKPRSM